MVDYSEIASGVLKGERRAVARAISIVEDGLPEADKLIRELYPKTGNALLVGVTGPTGAGKSSLINLIIKEYRERGKTVGVVAVDPSSPFTGGAMLGDRIRMFERSEDQDVFIRSMASRGSKGGLSRAARDAVRILDASGKEVILVETLGAGQTDIDVMKLAHATVVVLTPFFGDKIQALKAGTMEIGDLFVINKADLEGADRMAHDIEAMIREKNGWKPPVLKTNAKTGEGVPELIDAIDNFVEHLRRSGAMREIERRSAEDELIQVLSRRVTDRMTDKLRREGKFDEMTEMIMKRETDPQTIVEDFLKTFFQETKT